MRAHLQQTLDLKAHENAILQQTLDRMMQAAASLAKACMPLEAPAIEEDVRNQNPDSFVARLAQIAKAMKDQQDIFSTDPFADRKDPPSSKTKSLNGGTHDVFREQEVALLEQELEEKAVTIRELEQETHRQRTELQREKEAHNALALKHFNLMEKKVFGERSSSKR